MGTRDQNIQKQPGKKPKTKAPPLKPGHLLQDTEQTISHNPLSGKPKTR